MTTIRSGQAKIKIGDAALIARLDQISEGAVSSFTKRTTDELERVKTSAEARWPTRSGRSAGSFVIRTKITSTEISAQLANTSGYAFYVRWSVRTTADINRQIDEAAERGLTPETKALLRKRYQKIVWGRHGKGSPDAKLAGKSAWITLVRRPAKAALKQLLPDLQADLNKIAGG